MSKKAEKAVVKQLLENGVLPINVDLNTEFHDLGIDSLDVYENVMLLEDEFDITISDVEIEKLKTPQDLINLVNSLITEEVE